MHDAHAQKQRARPSHRQPRAPARARLRGQRREREREGGDRGNTSVVRPSVARQCGRGGDSDGVRAQGRHAASLLGRGEGKEESAAVSGEILLPGKEDLVTSGGRSSQR